MMIVFICEILAERSVILLLFAFPQIAFRAAIA